MAIENPKSNFDSRATGVRHRVVFVATLASLVLYLDRYCLSELLKYQPVVAELGLDEDQTSWSLSAFFWSYALMQVPAGWLADRFGPRRLYFFYMVGWSLFAAATGLADGFATLFLIRLGLGLMQAGAYPTSGNLLSRWVPLTERGWASSLIGFGGRVGAAAGLAFTTRMIVVSGHWRWIMLLYGGLGCAVAVAYGWIVRDWPAEHPRVNGAERSLIAGYVVDELETNTNAHQYREALRGFQYLLSSGNMWLMCLAQFTTNFGWVFLVTWLPRYLVEARGFSGERGANMNAIVLVAGMAGMLFGGRITDAATCRLGLRWGRALPIALSRFVAAAAFVAVPYLAPQWSVVAAFGLVAIATDLGVPATWAFAQDVGGKYVGVVLGWGNMWGNFGSAAAPVIVGWLSLREGPTMQWNAGLWACAAAFMISGIAAFGIDATKPVVVE